MPARFFSLVSAAGVAIALLSAPAVFAEPSAPSAPTGVSARAAVNAAKVYFAAPEIGPKNSYVAGRVLLVEWGKATSA